MGSRVLAANGDYLSGTPHTAFTAFGWTVVCWFNCNDLTAQRAVFSIGDSGSALDRYVCVLQTSGVMRMLDIDTASGVGDAKDTLNTYSINTWAMVALIVTDATHRRCILNGSTADAVNGTLSRSPAGTNSIKFGRSVNSGAFFRGSIAAAFGWPRALADDDIVDLWNGVHPGEVDPRLCLFIPYFDVGSPVEDWVGNNLTVFGSPTTSTDAPTIIGHPRW